MQRFVEDLTVDQIIPIEDEMATGSLDDLLSRLVDRDRITPRQFSTLYLATGSTPNTGYQGDQRVIPDRWHVATASGPNIAVVMTPDSVDDFALLWKLRAQWGDRQAMPVGVPRDEVNGGSLRKLREPGIATYFGLAGGRLVLTSESIDNDELRALIGAERSVGVASPHELLRLGLAPSRPRSEVATWTDGVARLAPLRQAESTP